MYREELAMLNARQISANQNTNLLVLLLHSSTPPCTTLLSPKKIEWNEIQTMRRRWVGGIHVYTVTTFASVLTLAFNLSQKAGTCTYLLLLALFNM